MEKLTQVSSCLAVKLSSIMVKNHQMDLRHLQSLIQIMMAESILAMQPTQHLEFGEMSTPTE